MRKKRFIRWNQNTWPIILLISICCSKWLFEDILGAAWMEPVLLAFCAAILVLQRRFRLKKAAGIWILYIFSILLNLLLNGTTAGILGRAGVALFTVAFVLFLECDNFDTKAIVDFILKVGMFHALMVFVHFLLRERFNAMYFPVMQSITREYAEKYFSGGRFFGILASPHEVAGLITFAILIIFSRLLITKETNLKSTVILGLLVMALFLTGKKSILGLALVTIVLMFFVLYGSKKYLFRLVLALAGSAVALAGLYVLIIKFPDSPLFYRITQFFVRRASGVSADSGRTDLYTIALSLWEENPLFGVGWRRFKGLTTTQFGYALGHEVNCDYLQWLCEMGIVGFALNMVPILVMGQRTLYICRKVIKNMPDQDVKAYTCFAVCVQFFTLMYAFVEIPFYDIMFFAIYIISCIIINSVYTKTRMDNHTNVYRAQRILSRKGQV